MQSLSPDTLAQLQKTKPRSKQSSNEDEKEHDNILEMIEENFETIAENVEEFEDFEEVERFITKKQNHLEKLQEAICGVGMHYMDENKENEGRIDHVTASKDCENMENMEDYYKENHESVRREDSSTTVVSSFTNVTSIETSEPTSVALGDATVIETDKETITVLLRDMKYKLNDLRTIIVSLFQENPDNPNENCYYKNIGYLYNICDKITESLSDDHLQQCQTLIQPLQRAEATERELEELKMMSTPNYNTLERLKRSNDSLHVYISELESEHVKTIAELKTQLNIISMERDIAHEFQDTFIQQYSQYSLLRQSMSTNSKSNSKSKSKRRKSLKFWKKKSRSKSKIVDGVLSDISVTPSSSNINASCTASATASATVAVSGPSNINDPGEVSYNALFSPQHSPNSSSPSTSKTKPSFSNLNSIPDINLRELANTKLIVSIEKITQELQCLKNHYKKLEEQSESYEPNLQNRDVEIDRLKNRIRDVLSEKITLKHEQKLFYQILNDTDTILRGKVQEMDDIKQDITSNINYSQGLRIQLEEKEKLFTSEAKMRGEFVQSVLKQVESNTGETAGKSRQKLKNVDPKAEKETRKPNHQVKNVVPKAAETVDASGENIEQKAIKMTGDELSPCDAYPQNTTVEEQQTENAVTEYGEVIVTPRKTNKEYYQIAYTGLTDNSMTSNGIKEPGTEMSKAKEQEDSEFQDESSKITEDGERVNKKLVYLNNTRTEGEEHPEYSKDVFTPVFNQVIGSESPVEMEVRNVTIAENPMSYLNKEYKNCKNNFVLIVNEERVENAMDTSADKTDVNDVEGMLICPRICPSEMARKELLHQPPVCPSEAARKELLLQLSVCPSEAARKELLLQPSVWSSEPSRYELSLQPSDASSIDLSSHSYSHEISSIQESTSHSNNTLSEASIVGEECSNVDTNVTETETSRESLTGVRGNSCFKLHTNIPYSSKSDEHGNCRGVCNAIQYNGGNCGGSGCGGGNNGGGGQKTHSENVGSTQTTTPSCMSTELIEAWTEIQDENCKLKKENKNMKKEMKKEKAKKMKLKQYEAKQDVLVPTPINYTKVSPSCCHSGIRMNKFAEEYHNSCLLHGTTTNWRSDSRSLPRPFVNVDREPRVGFVISCDTATTLVHEIFQQQPEHLR